jgi:N-acetylglucosamine-6-phosphate deacetylase
MTRLLFTHGLLLDPEAGEPLSASLLCEEGRIRALLTRHDAAPSDARVIDLAGAYLAPGFIDLHFHGSAVFSAPDRLHDALVADAASCVHHGCTAFLPTSVTQPMTHLGEFVTRSASWAASGRFRTAQALGLHLEGPWINPGAAGAQPTAGIIAFEPGACRELLDRGEGAIRMLTYAPELPGAAELQAELSRRGVIGALGHSLAGAEAVRAATDRGASHVTHLFNAMGPLHHRSPGLAVAALSDERLGCDLICDGAHVHPLVVDLARRCAGDRLSLITDRIAPPPGAGDGFGSGDLRDDGVAWRLTDGRLAGSRLGLDAALRNLMDFTGAALVAAVAACSLRPARVLGIESERGTLRPGARADFAVLDGALAVRETWVGGERVYAA